MILTLALDARSFDRLDRARQTFFPDRGYSLPAHLTLFHRLPDRAEGLIVRRLAAVAGRAPVPLGFTGLRDLGQGVAVGVDSAPLATLRASLAREWEPWLGAQDRRRFRPHVTVQNKVGREEARETFAELARGFVPWHGTGTGLLLWHYEGGPWRQAAFVPFRPA